jgi:hypothetical protein
VIAAATAVAALSIVTVALANIPPCQEAAVTVLVPGRTIAPADAARALATARADVEDARFVTEVVSDLPDRVKEALGRRTSALDRLAGLATSCGGTAVSVEPSGNEGLRRALEVRDTSGALVVMVRAAGRGIAHEVARAVARRIERRAASRADRARATSASAQRQEHPTVSPADVSRAGAHLAAASRAVVTAREGRERVARVRADRPGDLDPSLTRAAAAVADQELRIENLLVTLGGRHPDVVSARARLAQLVQARDAILKDLDGKATLALARAREEERAAREEVERLRTAAAPADRTPAPPPPSDPALAVLVLHDPKAPPVAPRPATTLAATAAIGFLVGLALAAFRRRAA